MAVTAVGYFDWTMLLLL